MKTRALAAIGAAHASGSRCWDPTWNETPAGSRPRLAAYRSTSTAWVVEHPYLRDSGQSEPSPDVTSRQSTALSGATAATLAVSSGVSTTKSRTRWAAANSMSQRRLTGLE